MTMNTTLEITPNLEMEVQNITAILFTLPLEKIIEVRDYTLFLQMRYGQTQTVAQLFHLAPIKPLARTENIAVDKLDIDDAWSEEDQQDFTFASMNYAEQLIGGDDEFITATR